MQRIPYYDTCRQSDRLLHHGIVQSFLVVNRLYTSVVSFYLDWTRCIRGLRYFKHDVRLTRVPRSRRRRA